MATIIRASSSGGGGTGDCASPAFLTASLAALRIALENDLDALQSALETAITDGNTSLLAAIESDLATLGTAILTAVASVKTDTTAIKAKTDNLPASPANEVTSAAIKAKTDNLPATPADEITSAAIKAKTDNLPASPASQTKLDTVEGLASGASGFAAIKTDTAAIKAKTDNLPSDPADASDIAALFATLQMGTNPLTGTSQQTSGTGGLANFSSYSQIIASSAKASNHQSFSIAVRNGNAAGDKILVQIAVGGAGSEVVIANVLFLVASSALDGHGFLTVDVERQFPAGTRFAYRSSCEGASGATIAAAWNVSQVA